MLPRIDLICSMRGVFMNTKIMVYSFQKIIKERAGYTAWYILLRMGIVFNILINDINVICPSKFIFFRALHFELTSRTLPR